MAKKTERKKFKRYQIVWCLQSNLLSKVKILRRSKDFNLSFDIEYIGSLGINDIAYNTTNQNNLFARKDSAIRSYKNSLIIND